MPFYAYSVRTVEWNEVLSTLRGLGGERHLTDKIPHHLCAICPFNVLAYEVLKWQKYWTTSANPLTLA